MSSWICAKEFALGGLILLLAVATPVVGRETLLVTSVVSCVLLAVYVAGVFRKDVFFSLLSLPVLFNYVWFCASFALFEFGAFTPELRMAGQPTGGTARLALFLYIFIVFALLGYRLVTARLERTGVVARRLPLVLPIFAFVALAIAATYLVYGTAFSNAVDRIQYRTTIAPKPFFPLITVLVFLSFFLGLYRRSLAGQRWRPLMVDGLFVISMLLLALGGEKFSLLFTSISLYLAPQFWDRKLEFSWRGSVKYVLLTVLVLGAVVLLAINQYSEIAGGQVWDVIGGLFLDRIAQQAQLNFYFDKLMFVDGSAHDGFVVFFEREILGLDVGGEYRGIQLLMNAASPSDLYALYANTGVTFGDGFPGILLYYFGWSTALFMAFFGMLYGVMTGLCARVSIQGQVITGLVLFYLFYNLSLSAFMNGELYLLFGMTASKAAALGILLIVMAWRYWAGSARPGISATAPGA